MRTWLFGVLIMVSVFGFVLGPCVLWWNQEAPTNAYWNAWVKRHDDVRIRAEENAWARARARKVAVWMLAAAGVAAVCAYAVGA